MTSSLVGSEMCIRDRKQGAGYVQVLRRLGTISGPIPKKTCLLYTSDAADVSVCRSRWSPYH
eukprot:5505366-Prorocentrum_lima.AAC.1